MLGERLRQWRKDAGVTQEEIAHKLSVSREYVGLIERGKKDPGKQLERQILNLIKPQNENKENRENVVTKEAFIGELNTHSVPLFLRQNYPMFKEFLVELINWINQQLLDHNKALARILDLTNKRLAGDLSAADSEELNAQRNATEKVGVRIEMWQELLTEMSSIFEDDLERIKRSLETSDPSILPDHLRPEK